MALPAQRHGVEPDGLLLFTLQAGKVDAAGQISAAWPHHLIRVQSRRHCRLSAQGGPGRRVWLRCHGMDVRLPVRDLRESGVCFEVVAGLSLSLQPAGAAELHLDDAVLDIPAVEVVHTRASRRGEPQRVGARRVGLGEERLRALRRWLAILQTGALAAPGDQS